VAEVRQTAAFVRWFESLKDLRAKARLQTRIDRLELGVVGDVKFFQGIGEMRVDYGPGYRIYFVRKGKVTYLLLCGGDKSSQERDIRKAIEMAKELE
jgi:putative addiction module killer protein